MVAGKAAPGPDPCRSTRPKHSSPSTRIACFFFCRGGRCPARWAALVLTAERLPPSPRRGKGRTRATPHPGRRPLGRTQNWTWGTWSRTSNFGDAVNKGPGADRGATPACRAIGFGKPIEVGGYNPQSVDPLHGEFTDGATHPPRPIPQSRLRDQTPLRIPVNPCTHRCTRPDLSCSLAKRGPCPRHAGWPARYSLYPASHIRHGDGWEQEARACKISSPPGSPKRLFPAVGLCPGRPGRHGR